MADPDAPASDRLRSLQVALGAAIDELFPTAEPVEAHGMTGWQVRLRDPPPEASWRGTFDRTLLQVFVAGGRSGITVHVWHPNHPDLLRRHEAGLAAVGWRVMVGCLRWTRRTDPPVAPLRDVLGSVRE